MINTELRSIGSELEALHASMLAAEATCAADIAATHPLHRRSAANLVHYTEFRRHDVRALQTGLSLLGLSSLGRSEPYVLATIEGLLAVVAGLLGHAPGRPTAQVSLEEGQGLLVRDTNTLLGPTPISRQTRIMVTMPSEAADDEGLVGALIGRGMDVARVNCAHDDRSAWAGMVAVVRAGPNPDGRPCRVAMDLAGPKLRTGPLQPGPRVVKVKPVRDDQGRFIDAARVRLIVSTGPQWALADRRDTSIIDVPVNEPSVAPKWHTHEAPGSGRTTAARYVAARVLDVFFSSRRDDMTASLLRAHDVRGDGRR